LSFSSVTQLVDQFKVETLMACDAELKETLNSSYQNIISEHKDLCKQIKDSKEKIQLVEYLAEELGYQKEFVDKHPF